MAGNVGPNGTHVPVLPSQRSQQLQLCRYGRWLENMDISTGTFCADATYTTGTPTTAATCTLMDLRKVGRQVSPNESSSSSSSSSSGLYASPLQPSSAVTSS